MRELIVLGIVPDRVFDANESALQYNRCTSNQNHPEAC